MISGNSLGLSFFHLWNVVIILAPHTHTHTPEMGGTRESRFLGLGGDEPGETAMGGCGPSLSCSGSQSHCWWGRKIASHGTHTPHPTPVTLPDLRPYGTRPRGRGQPSREVGQREPRTRMCRPTERMSQGGLRQKQQRHRGGEPNRPGSEKDTGARVTERW